MQHFKDTLTFLIRPVQLTEWQKNTHYIPHSIVLPAWDITVIIFLRATRELFPTVHYIAILPIYSHFAYLLPLGAISPTQAKCGQNNVKQLKQTVQKETKVSLKHWVELGPATTSRDGTRS